jgi:hypothetical protein
LHPKFYKLEFFLDVKAASNYTQMLKLTEISITILVAFVVLLGTKNKFHPCEGCTDC